MVSDDRMEKALRFLAETDRPCAEAKVEAERMEYRAKAARQAVFLHESGTVAERQARAELHADVTVAMDAYFAALATWQQLQHKRGTEQIVIEVWRSLNASRRQGHV